MNPFIELLARRATSEKMALKSDLKSYTYQQLFDESKKLASMLKEVGMIEGDISVVACAPGFEFLKVIYATMMLKAKVAIIDPHMGRELYQKKLEQLNPKFAFIDSRLLLLQEHPILRLIYKGLSKNGIYIPFSKKYKTIATGRKLPLLQKHIKASKAKNYEPIKLDHNHSDFEYIITYTSGTINDPKGVVQTVNSVNESIGHVVDLLSKTRAETLATHLPHFMLIGICAGLEVNLWSEDWSPGRKIKFIEENNIHVLFGPPTEYLKLIEYCNKVDRKLPACLQHLIIGSAPAHIVFLEKLANKVEAHTRLTCMYGMTEHLLAAYCDGRKKIAYQCEGDLLGTLVKGVKVKISEDNEILIKSQQLFKNYLGKENHEGFHATGDLGTLDANGNLLLTGRKKDMIIRKNFNIYPALYEPTIKKLIGIEEAVLIGTYNDEIADEKVTLVVEAKQDLSEKKIYSAIKNGKYSIDAEALPDEIIFRNIPRKGRQNKIDRERLRNELASQL